MKHCLGCLIQLLNRNKNNGINGEVKSSKSMLIEPDRVTKPPSQLWFSLFYLDEYNAGQAGNIFSHEASFGGRLLDTVV